MEEEKNEVEGTKKEMRLLNTTCNIIICTKKRKKNSWRMKTTVDHLVTEPQRKAILTLEYSILTAYS